MVFRSQCEGWDTLHESMCIQGNEGESGCGDVESGGESRIPLGKWESGDLGEGRGEESTLTPLYLRAWGGLAYYLQAFVYKFLQIFFTLKYIHAMERTSISVHIFSIQMMSTT